MDTESQKKRISRVKETIEKNTLLVGNWYVIEKSKYINQLFDFLFPTSQGPIVPICLAMVELEMAVLGVMIDQIESTSIEEIDNGILKLCNEFCDFVKHTKYPYAIKHIEID
jgi:hypothetical protein